MIATEPQEPQHQPVRLETQVVEIIRELLIEQGKERAAKSLNEHSSFQRDLGLASLDLVELVIRCETRLEIELPDDIAEQADSAAGWAKAIQQGSQETEAKPAYRIVPPSGDAPPAPTGARNLIEVLRHHAEAAPGRIHIHLLQEGHGRGITCAQLLESATLLARGFLGEGLKRGDRVAILLPNSAEFFEAFFGVVLAGGIPVPLYLPAADSVGDYVRRQAALLHNVGARSLVTFETARSMLRILRAAVPSVRGTTVDRLRKAGTQAPSRLPDPAEHALIQHTSGSTGDPKAVALTHAGILANLRATGDRMGVRPGDAVVSWLPLAGDFGLVGSWLFSLYHGAPLTQLSPIEFQTRPESWLWAIHDSRGTLSAAPSYAYEQCARRIPLWTLEGIDLSTWKSAVVAGEPAYPEVMERFVRRFAFADLRPDVFLPCYGLAENSVALAMPTPGAPLGRNGKGAVSVGTPLQGTQVRIVDADDGGEGRLEFRGPSAFAGYWMNGKFVPMASADGWVDSGDLAILEKGDLFITGRDKETIRKQGRNLAPQWIEAAATDVPSIRPGGVGAIGVPDDAPGTERLVIVAESTAEPVDALRVRAAVVNAVTSGTGMVPDEVVLIAPGSLPKTANGKPRRNTLQSMYRSGKLGGTPPGPRGQMTRLWAAHLPRLAADSAQRAFRGTRQGLAGALAATIAVAGGCVARIPGLRRWVGPFVRLVLSILGQTPQMEGSLPSRAAVIATNRTSPLDPLLMMAVLGGPSVLCDEDAVLGLRGATRFLLRAALVPRGTSDVELRAGHNVILFPDAPVGAPARRCRFRLEALQAAIEENKPVVPAAIVRVDGRILVRFADAIVEPGEDARALRGQIRSRIADLFA